MPAQYTLTRLNNAISNAASNIWQTAKSYLAVEPVLLWEKAMHEPGYQKYLKFKSDLKYHPEAALGHIVSPYAVITKINSTPQIKMAIEKQLQFNPERTLRYFYCVFHSIRSANSL